MDTSYLDVGGGTTENLPQGTVTFVLGDVVGSTAMWESNPDAAAMAIATLDGIVAKLVDSHGGAKPVEQGEGDSFVAAFAHAIDAASFVVDLQRTIALEPWPVDGALAVRVGIHTGDVRLQDGLYRGETLNRCARIRALAHGGQTLVSDTTAGLVVDGLSDGIFLKDMGLTRLRDLSRPEHLRQLCHPDLPVEFPSLRSLDRLPHNLPLQLTSFVGRENELVAVGTLLDDCRLITLTGAGGSGKTRLALHVAAAAVDRFVDGVWLVDLSSVTDPELVARSVAHALGVHELPFEDVVSALERFLRDRHVLLVIDNCEHLIDTCARVIDRLVSSCDRVSVLATSRESLGVAGEITHRVPSLALPDDDTVACASIELFAARAIAVRPTFRLGHENLHAIAAICRRLDGLPLAIELAAARCRALSPHQIAQQLEERFSLLSGGARTALPRQRTLEASVGWSIDMLGDEERTLLRRLSVFAGSFSLEAAEAVGTSNAQDAWRVVDLLTSLVDKSLVQLDERADDVRYRLLETIRHFATHELLAANESNDARNAHADYYVRHVREIAPGLTGPTVTECYAALDREMDNSRAAQSWLVHTQDAERALELVAALHLPWSRIAGPEVLRSLDEVIALEGGDPATRARAMLAAGEVAWLVGDLDRNLELLDGVDEIARTLGDENLATFATLLRGWRGLLLSDPTTDALLERARDGFWASDQPYWSADALYGMGSASIMRGNLVGGDVLLAEAVGDARRSRNPVALGRALVVHAIAVMQRGGLGAAESMLDEVAALQTSTADSTGAMLEEAMRGWIAIARGHYETARAHSARVTDGSRRAGLTVTLSWGLWISLGARRATGDLDDLIVLVEELEQTIGLPWAGAWCDAVRAELDVARGDLVGARSAIDAALATTVESVFAGYARSRCLLTRARVLRAAGDGAAEDDAFRALSSSVAGDLRLETIEALELLASFAVEHDASVEDGARLLGAARRARSDMGAPVPPLTRPEIDATVEKLQSTLQPPRLATLLEEGAHLDVAGAQSYAERGRGTRGRPTSGWQSLTPTEARVVELAAQGLKNADIATRLFVSVPTVKTHLAHVFTKLGVSTRAELAARAARRA